MRPEPRFRWSDKGGSTGFNVALERFQDFAGPRQPQARGSGLYHREGFGSRVDSSRGFHSHRVSYGLAHQRYRMGGCPASGVETGGGFHLSLIHI